MEAVTDVVCKVSKPLSTSTFDVVLKPVNFAEHVRQSCLNDLQPLMKFPRLPTHAPPSVEEIKV